MKLFNSLAAILFVIFSVEVAAQQIPIINLEPVDQTVCEGDSAGFIIQASGDGQLQYQWQHNDVDLPEETDSVCVVTAAFDSHSGNYRCIVSNENGSDTTEIASLTVDIVLPTIIMGPREVENVDTVLYSVVTTPGHTYEFFITEGIILQSTDTTVIIEWGYNEVGFVKVLESTSNGCYGDTVSRRIIVGDVVPFFTVHPLSQTVCLSDSVSFEVSADGTSELVYQWQLDGNDIYRETSKTLTVKPVELADEGDYTCIVSNSVGTDTCQPAYLDIDLVEPAEIAGAENVDVNDTITYSVVPTENHSYEFSVSGGEMIATTDTSMTVLWDTAGISYVHLVETNSLGCVGETVDYQVLVFGEGMMVIFLQQPESQGVCLNDSVSFVIEASGYPELTYQWQKNEIDIENENDSILIFASAQFDDNADYRCVATNDFGLNISDVATLSVDEIEPTDILGPIYVQEYEVVVYSVPFKEGHVYQFVVNGGNIIQSTQNSINVQWGASGYGSVQMLESIENGCVGEWVEMEVFVGTVGVENNKDDKVKIHPNPVIDYVNISAKGQYIFRLYDILGNLVIEKPFDGAIKLDVSDLEQGMYIYRLGDKTGRLIKK